MAASGEEQGKGQGKGFAGLFSLVSDVDMPPPAVIKERTRASGVSATNAGRSASQGAQPQLSRRRTYQKYQEPPQTSTDSSGSKWVLGIVALIGVLWFASETSKKPSLSPPPYTPPEQGPQVLSRPKEVRPPVGQDLVLSLAEIRYCLAEDIRIEGAKSALNNRSKSEVERFNAMVDDYNSRCTKFRYQNGALESARRDIEPYRSQLQTEGRNLLR